MVDTAGSRSRIVVGGAVAVLLAALAVVTPLTIAPPPVRPADAAPGEFSAARAMAHLDRIAERPHPLGTDDNQRVREYVAAAARAAGAEVSVESGEVVNPRGGNPFPVATTHNVVARVAGSEPEVSGGEPILLVAHYDSVPTGPGAADAGSAVAALLETMRALAAGGGVRNDVVFLFTDGEELGLLGATRYVGDHGVESFGAVLNWEARGSRGPVFMFETSQGNRRLIEAFAGASSRPVATSLAYEVYQRMPNDTDFTVFREAGAVGLNAAFIGGLHDYHSVSDTPRTLDQRSMQHHGETMLGMARALGGVDLRELRAGDAVYFDLFARVLVHYPAGVVIPLAAVSVLGLLVLLWYGLRRSALRPGGVLAVAGIGLGAAVVAALACMGLWRLVLLARPELTYSPLTEPHDRGAFAAGFAVVALAVLVLAARLVRGRTTAELVGGGLVLLAVLLVGITAVVPGASYLVQFPLLAGLPALWWAVRGADLPERPTRSHESPDTPGLILAALAPAVAIVLFSPVVDNLMVALGMRMAGLAMAVALLGGVVLQPLLARLPRGGALSGATAIAGVAVLVLAVAGAGYTAENPRPNALIYVNDTVDDRTLWLTGDPRPDDWTSTALGDDPAVQDAVTYLPQFAGRQVRTAPAPEVDLPAPTVELLDESTDGDARTVRFRAESTRSAWKLQVRLPVDGLRSCTVAGERLDAEALRRDADLTGGVVFHRYGETGGLELSCEIDANSELPVEVTDYTISLPAAVADLVDPRPAVSVPVQHGARPSDTSIVRMIEHL